MCFFLFFKHKTAYEMRISDWSSDVCSSDLARGDWTEKVEGIEAGADDYLAKPFQMGELVARVRGLVRRGAGKLSPVIEIGRLRLDTVRMSASFDGAPARISPLEFRLLDYLAHQDRKSTRLNSSHYCASRMPSSA